MKNFNFPEPWKIALGASFCDDFFSDLTPRIDELVDGAYVLRAQFNNSWERDLVVKANGKIYAPRNNNDETIMELKFPTDGSTTGTFVQAIMTGSGTSYDEYYFDFDSAGNIYESAYNNDENQYILSSYQQNPEFKIAAGATTATVTFATLNDTTDEANETIIVTPGTAVNATLSDATAVTLTITDNDDPAVVTMALSSSTIVEDQVRPLLLLQQLRLFQDKILLFLSPFLVQPDQGNIPLVQPLLLLQQALKPERSLLLQPSRIPILR